MSAVVCEPVPKSPDRVCRLPAVPPLIAVLRQLADLIDSMTDEQYCCKPVAVVPSSVGGHVRHSLDHIEAILAGLDGGLIDYDRRRRDTPVAHCRRAALAAIDHLERQLLGDPLRGYPAGRPGRLLMRLSVLLTPDGPPVEVTTTLGRELAFALSHTIHHNSLIAVMAKLMGVPVPADFGYAPSTVAHREGRTCAR